MDDISNLESLCFDKTPSVLKISDKITELKERIADDEDVLTSALKKIILNDNINNSDKYELLKKAKSFGAAFNNEVVYSVATWLSFRYNRSVIKLTIFGCNKFSHDTALMIFKNHYPANILLHTLQHIDKTVKVDALLNICILEILCRNNGPNDEETKKLLTEFKRVGAKVLWYRFNDLNNISTNIKTLVYDYVLSSFIYFALCLETSNLHIPPELMFRIYKDLVYTRITHVNYILETSDHDGYCSGDECEYAKDNLDAILAIPDNVKDVDGFCWGVLNEIANSKLGGGSGYCDLSPESIANNLANHDFRVTIEDTDTKYKDGLRWFMDK